MKRSHVSIIAVLAALVGPVMTSPAAARSSSEPAAASGRILTQAHFGGHSQHGWRGGHRFGRLCGERREEHLGRVIDFVEGIMQFTPEQERAWGDLKNAVRAGNAKVDEACATLEEGETPGNAPERLARLETMMTAGVAVIREVRPAFEAFYGSLSEKQQRALDQLISRGRGH